MLIGFFKKSEEYDCDCVILQYCDRIWLNESGKGQFWRMFVVEVDKKSPKELSSLQMLVPVRNLLLLEDINHTCFDKDYRWNSQALRSTANYKIKDTPKNDGSYNDHGRIDDDDIKDIVVFTNMDQTPGKLTFGDQSGPHISQTTFISFDFPEPLAPGTKSEIRMQFDVTSLLDITDPDTLCPICNLTLGYFNYNSFTKEISMLGKDNQIKVNPILNKTTRSGGFDVILYLPPKFNLVHGFDNMFERQSVDRHERDGSEHEVKQKYIWRLRKFYPPNRLVGIGDELVIDGAIRREYPAEETLQKISNGVNKKMPGQIKKLENDMSSIEQAQQQQSNETTKIKKRITTGNILSIIAIIVSVGVAVVTFVINYVWK